MIRPLEEIGELAALPGPVNLAIGIFDGVHQGHVALIDAVTGRSGTPVVLTFDPHPAEVLGVAAAPGQITTSCHKMHVLGRLGVKFLLSVEFNHLRAVQKAEDFVREIAASCDLGCIAVGGGFRFGKGREGDVKLLLSLGSQMGFDVCDIDPVCDGEGRVVSSTRVRAALEAGDLDLVAGLLGRPYSLLGKVDEGRRLGRKIGFPTANLALRAQELLPCGVYAVGVDLDGEYIDGVANLGTRPTISPGQDCPLLEVHLFDFNRDIYGREIEVFFKAHIRDEQAFEGIDALREQIAKDIELAQSLLG